MVQAHDANYYKLTTFNVGRRFTQGIGQSQCVITGGLLPGNAAPYVSDGLRCNGAYARRLETELPQAQPPANGLRLAEFFCGCGGIGLGFRSAGFELAFANDYYQEAASSYERNLRHDVLVRDIRQVSAGDVRASAGADVDVLTGGFPCVTFSIAGKRMGVNDDVAGKLYLELCRLIETVRPRYFVAENVEGILSANGGAAVVLVCQAFARIGYRTCYQLINAAEYGVPQLRHRVIFVGVREDQWRGTFLYPRKTHRLAQDKRASKWLPLAVNVREAIGDLPEPVAGENPSASIPGAHRMTARECARVQSFPDWFEFSGKQADHYRQIGNAVPPLYAKQLALAIAEYDKRSVIGGVL